ncbi:MAG: class I SAM-dependent methyltransferase [Bacteroidetes bacterium]|nr:class I SAM-dependent methyltransferase [Bacteroidota bacterium]
MTYKWDYLDTQGYNNKTGRYRSAVQLKFIRDNVDRKFDSLLDIAGGSGRIAIPLLDYSSNITVTDIDESALQILKERNLGIHTVCDDFTHSEFGSTFSLIVCIEGPDYFKDWPAFFRKVSSLLEKEGKFIFTYTNPSSWRYILRKVKQLGKKDPYHVLKYKDLEKLLCDCNLKIEKKDGFNWTLLPVISNSALTSVFAFIEKTFRLNKWHSQSPWLMISVKKEN